MRLQISTHALAAMEERDIRLEWIERAVEAPAASEADRRDPRLLHYLKPIRERGGLVLRVIVDPDADPHRVVSVFFDRRMKGKL
jgi:hypothetical protein